jgi:hypothetical protein
MYAKFQQRGGGLWVGVAKSRQQKPALACLIWFQKDAWLVFSWYGSTDCITKFWLSLVCPVSSMKWIATSWLHFLCWHTVKERAVRIRALVAPIWTSVPHSPTSPMVTTKRNNITKEAWIIHELQAWHKAIIKKKHWFSIQTLYRHP